MSCLKYITIVALVFLTGVCSAAIEPKQLRCEYLSDPLGIDTVKPRLSWILESQDGGEKQTAYQILVASSVELLNEDTGDLWDSGKVISDESSQVIFAGKPLSSRQRCFWKLRAWGGDGAVSSWSSMALWQMGLTKPEDWHASWIAVENQVRNTNDLLVIRHATYGAIAKSGAADVTDVLSGHVRANHLIVIANYKTFGEKPDDNVVKRLRVEYEYAGKAYTKEIDENQILELPKQSWSLPYLRKSFQLKGPVQRAVLYAAALGLYEAHVNGKRVGDHVLAPDWTDYRKRVRYQAYDVTALLNSGGNAMTVLLAPGWFSGHIGLGASRFFGKTPAFLAQLEVTYADGSTEQMVTDDSWKWHGSPVLDSDFMMGEDYDSRLEMKGWDQSGLDESQWNPVIMRDESARKLEAQVSEPVRQLCELEAKSMSEPKPGCWVYDLGQNMAGVVRIKVSAPAGTKVTLRHAEMLNPDGTLYTKNLRGAPSVDHYICKGAGIEIWQPRFTVHGFRYVEISGLPSRPDKSDVMGIVIGSDTSRTGEFSCSDPRLNQLQSNIQWSQRGNYLSIPTDCPQRDERLGWMGDAEVFIRTATYNADVSAFFTKWLVDVDDGQSPSGAFSDVSPDTLGSGGAPAWGDAGVICPWIIYQVYGDKRILAQHLPAMTKWVDYLCEHSTNFICDKDRGKDYGDWLSIGADTPKDLIGTAFFACSTHLLAKSCRALGHVAEAEKYERMFEDIKAAFSKRYVADDGHIKGNTQCAYALALQFDLMPEALRPKAAQYLDEDIQSRGCHLSTGLIGSSHLLLALTRAGKADTACRLLFQDTFPSWLFQVKHGATTIWERWDSWTPEKGFQNPRMNSFNHYSLGSCGEFLFSGIGGIQPASPGFKTILIEPVICNELTWARTSYDSIHGRISTAWQRQGDRLELEVVVPVNTTAIVVLPASDIADVTESGMAVKNAKRVMFLRMSERNAVFEVGSGNYQFKTKFRP